VKPNKPWHYVEHNKTFGPMEEAYIHVLVKAGQLDGHTTLVWQEGMDGWWFYDEIFGKKGMLKRRPVPANAPPLPVLSATPTEFAIPAQQEASSIEVGSANNQPSLVKGTCQHCGGHLEFSSLNKGETIDCPHCRKQTRLEQKPALVDAHSKQRAKSLPVRIPIGRQERSPSKHPPKG
jgi:DNA-directed RNA polymerase subunit RPC12/RpoP